MKLSKEKEKEWRETAFRKRVDDIDILNLLKDRNKNKAKIIEALDNEITKIKNRKRVKK